MKKLLFVLLIAVCAVYLSQAEDQACVGRSCSKEYKPVCGMRYVGHYPSIRFEKRIFGNLCLLEAQNDCGAGFQLCVD